jgi:uncharacterized lipoprotein YddW (UPF0748 family)
MAKNTILLCLFFLGMLSLWAQDYELVKEDANAVAPFQESQPYPDATTIPKRGQEWRAFWVDAWNKGVYNAAQVKEVVQIAAGYGYNAIVVQVRRRGDAIYFPTAPNTEPRMAGLAGDFDALYEMIREAHSAKIEVHAWLTTFLISTATPPTAAGHVFNRHPEYLTENINGEKNIAEGYYLDPGNPEALSWNGEVLMDLVNHYDIDGIHFDYVRYPQQNAGYNPTAITRYNKEFGLSGKPPYTDANFSAWRRRQISDWLRKMYVEIIARKPEMKVTAATFASRGDAYQNRFQDWAQWMLEGSLDANLPMNYSTGDATYQTRAVDALQHAYGRHVYMGAGAYLLAPDATVGQLLYARAQGASGLLFFSYAANNKGGSDWRTVFAQFQQNVFATPAAVPDMPWKTTPRHGSLCGRVTRTDGSPVYNARVVVGGKCMVRTDADGIFSFPVLNTGTFTLSCQGWGYAVETEEIVVVAGRVTSKDFLLKTGATTAYILDNNDAQWIGNWDIGVGAPDKFGSDYRFIMPGNGSNRAVFVLPRELSGRYRLSTWYSGGSNRATAACYEVHQGSRVTQVAVNQRQNGGTWHLLGSWEFNAGEEAAVHIPDQFAGGDVVIADAIKLEK